MMMSALLLPLLVFVSQQQLSHGLVRDLTVLPNRLTDRVAAYQWEERWLDNVPIDHFSYADARTFRLRYFLNATYYRPGATILFYTGNEGNLEGFAQNTGLMWEMAEQLGAAVVFAEHRFYGKTQPFGNDSYATTKNLGYLSSAQALADFVLLIRRLKEGILPGAHQSAVIAFGGSYGGMLAAWLRVKFPHAVQGAIASSAPVYWFVGGPQADDAYDAVVSRAFLSAGCNTDNVMAGWRALDKLSTSAKGRAFLNALFRLETKSWLKKSEDVHFLKYFINEAMGSMAMVNYPYPTSFLTPLPGWPVKAACKWLSGDVHYKRDEDAAAALFRVVSLYYNYTGQKAELCANPAVCDGAFAALGDPLGWPWQTCTEMVMPMCKRGPPRDLFWNDCPFSEDAERLRCLQTFGPLGWTSPLLRRDDVFDRYGASFPTATNILFVNGRLDPWSAGGWRRSIESVDAIQEEWLELGAHHYDLRGSHPLDTAEVRALRKRETQLVIRWSHQHQRSLAMSVKRLRNNSGGTA